jgi:Delta7-sterol 5-desaturase
MNLLQVNISLFYRMDLPDFTSGYWVILLTLIFFIIITGRYFLVAGLFYLIFYVWFPEKWEAKKINKRAYPSGQFKKEIKWSLITSLLFSVAGTITIILWQKGYTKVYTKIDEYGWWYLPVSLVIFMLLQETYYYWMHRWMHIPSIYKIVHKVHHESKIASPFTAFSFHPLEGLLQAIFLPILLMILPMYYYIIIVLLTIMTFSSVINHLDIEIYPKNLHTTWTKWVIGATHHSFHHKQFKYNYGLYFTFWDKIKKTESPDFEKKIDR